MNGHEDCTYWQLTNEQCFRYHLRLARRFAADAHRLGAVAERHAANASWVSWIGTVVLLLLTLSLFAQVIA